MDSEEHQSSDIGAKKKERKNEKTKKVKSKDADIDEVCKQMSKLVEDESESTSVSSTDSEDLVNAINYNTITSLAALKDIIQGDSNDTPETDSFFQHYFMNHCNNLSSRNSCSPFPFPERRRLSQCREEDEEYDSRKESDPPPSAISSETDSVTSQENIRGLDNEDSQNNDEKNSTSEPSKVKKRTVIGARHKFLVTSAEPQDVVQRALLSHVHNAHTVHFGTKGPEELRPNVRAIFAGQNLHRDKKYFDSSLIQLVDSSSTIDGAATSTEDIWVKRIEEKKSNVMNEPSSETGDTGKAIKDKNNVTPRARSGTWSSQSVRSEKVLPKKAQVRNKEPRKSTPEDKRQKREQRLDAAITRSTQSVGERRHRISSDDAVGHPMYQQTIHGTSGVSRKPALFDMFKSRQRGDVKRPPSIMKQVKAAMQSMTKSGPVSKEAVRSDSLSEKDTVQTETAAPVTPIPVKNKDGSAHPHSGSDTRYYHTVTAAASVRRPSAMAKVMDIFRGRPSVPGLTGPSDGAERRKTISLSGPYLPTTHSHHCNSCKPAALGSATNFIRRIKKGVRKFSNFPPSKYGDSKVTAIWPIAIRRTAARLCLQQISL